jgi:hypothetical protein
MSQEKVDKHKEEKKNRAKTIRRNKILKGLVIFLCSMGVGALVGIPIGRKIYKEQKKKEAMNKTVLAPQYDEWFDQFWVDEYSDFFVGQDYTNYQDLIDQFNNQTATDASSTDSESSETAE